MAGIHKLDMQGHGPFFVRFFAESQWLWNQSGALIAFGRQPAAN